MTVTKTEQIIALKKFIDNSSILFRANSIDEKKFYNKETFFSFSNE